MAFDLGNPSAFIFHHTGGRSDPLPTLQQRGLGVQYIMDRDGSIRQVGGAGASHMLPGWGAGAGLSNKNTVGMEVIARDNKDVTPQQVAAAQKFISENYPNIPVYGHGEVNPGHKDADEGLAIVNSIRDARAAPRPPMPIPLMAANVPPPIPVQPPAVPSQPFSLAPTLAQAPPPPPQPMLPQMAAASPQPQPGLDEMRQQSEAAMGPQGPQQGGVMPPNNIDFARQLMAAMQARQLGQG